MDRHIKFLLNDSLVSIESNPAVTLLDFLRKSENLTGTKEGCREGDCGACTVLLGEYVNGKLVYKSVNSCLFPLGLAEKKHVVTIEGLSNTSITSIQQEFNNEGATQCGFCTPGFIISLTGYFLTNNKYDTTRAINSIAGNICRCTGYASIIRSINSILENFRDIQIETESKINLLTEKKIIPEYFLNIPQRLSELKKDTKEEGDLSGIIIGGGTDLYVQKEEELLSSSVSFLDSKKISKIFIEDDKCHIGGSVTIEQLKNSEVIQKFIPILNNKLDLFASLPIRNSATIGGNIVNASPIGDSTIIFLALNSLLTLNNSGKTRTIPLAEFYKGYKLLDLDPGEIVEAVVFNVPDTNTFFNFEKVSKRTHLDIASVNSAINITINDGIIKEVSISAGGVAPIPLLLSQTSSFLLNKNLDTETLLEAVSIARNEISPISDIRGSAEYKSLLLGQLIKAHFIELFPQLINIDEVLA